MRSIEKRLPLYPLAPNQPITVHPRPRIHELSDKQIRNFEKRIVKTDSCWNWIGGHNWQGRGNIKLYNVQMVTPRVSFALHYKQDPGNWDVLHTCDNPSCVNPKHLFLGTPQINADDRHEKGRFVASFGNTKIKPNSKEESILLDESIPVTIVAKRLRITRKAVWERRRKAGKGTTHRGRKLGVWSNINN